MGRDRLSTFQFAFHKKRGRLWPAALWITCIRFIRIRLTEFSVNTPLGFLSRRRITRPGRDVTHPVMHPEKNVENGKMGGKEGKWGKMGKNGGNRLKQGETNKEERMHQHHVTFTTFNV